MNPQLCAVCKTTFDSGGSRLSSFSNVGSLCSTTARQQASEAIKEEISNIQNIIQGFERQILEFQSKIRYWNTRQNELCGISILPADVLTEIWSYLAENSGQSIALTVRLLRISHVCSRWRNLALNTPALWRWPCIMRPELASHLINRAGNSPISLYVDFNQIVGTKGKPGQRDSRQVFDFAGHLVHRAQSLALRTKQSMRAWSPVFVSLLTNSTLPNLEEIWFEYTNHDSAARRELDVVAFIHQAPALRKITLRNTTCFEPPLSSSKPLSNITRLSIVLDREVPERPSEPHVPLHQVLSNLKTLPSLAELFLINVFRPLDEDDEESCRAPRQPIKLEYLKKLVLRAGLVPAHLFLSNITYPVGMKLRIDFFSDSARIRSEISERDAFHNLLAITLEQIGQPIRSLVMGRDTRDIRYSAVFYTSSSPSGQFQLQLTWAKGRSEFFTYIPQANPFQQLEFLNYSAEYSDMGIWQGFGLLPNLEKIVNLDLDKHPTFLKVLASYQSSEDSIFEYADLASDPQLHFPSLYALGYYGSLCSQESLGRIWVVRRASVENSESSADSDMATDGSQDGNSDMDEFEPIYDYSQ